ncbi:site-specific integrase [Nocardioidaceae bacterium SCSIO 66511]|nr:site-specific integrase [Nocardioidaceae bacterium SCSIO 66511]
MASIERRTREDDSGKEIVSYRVRWRDPDGRQRAKTFRLKRDAERHRDNVAADLVRGQYIDPDAGKVTFEKYAAGWLEAQTFDMTSRDIQGRALRRHVYPVLGGKQMRQIKPSTVQSWLRGLSISESYQHDVLGVVSAIFTAAVDDEVVRSNPCKAGSVRAPRRTSRKVVPWSVERVHAVRDALPERYRIVATLAAGLGLRQGEVFGLSVDDVDFLGGEVHVRRQVRQFSTGGLAFRLPKSKAERTVPLPSSVRDALAAHLAVLPAQRVVLPWGTPDGSPSGFDLIVTSKSGDALVRNEFNRRVWVPALKGAEARPSRENGMHALRHYYASALLDAGENIRALSEYLGHTDPGFTLRTYTHLMPSSGERARRAIDAALRVPAVSTEGGANESSQVSA